MGCCYGDYMLLPYPFLRSCSAGSFTAASAVANRPPRGGLSADSHKALRDVCLQDEPQATGFCEAPLSYRRVRDQHIAITGRYGMMCLPLQSGQSGLLPTRPHVCRRAFVAPTTGRFLSAPAREVVPLLHLAAVLRSVTESTPSHMKSRAHSGRQRHLSATQ